MRSVLGKVRCVCAAVAAGGSVLAGCRRAGVSRATFYRWADLRPAVAAIYQQACRERLAVVDSNLAMVRDEIAEIRATVPDERPRGGVTFRQMIRAIVDETVPVHVLEKMRTRTSRRTYRRKRSEMWQSLAGWFEWRDSLRLERARLRGRLDRCRKYGCS